MIAHGGNLRAAMARYGGEAADWVDLSTGLNPHAYPAPDLPRDIWHRLPENDPALVRAACAYYGAAALLPVAGTQAAIQALPRLRPASRVAIVSPTYAEHALRWRQAGHAVSEIPATEIAATLGAFDVVVVCNPNNPTGLRIPAEELRGWANALAARDGWLVVDEAFGDTDPVLSVIAHATRSGLIVLRSVGKFFGLAGLRLGFVAADAEVLERLASALGPWSISAAAQHIGQAALRDTAWQADTRQRVTAARERLQALLARHDIPAQGTDLFQWWPDAEAARWQEHFAGHRLWTRRFAGPAQGIRLGLPPDESAWARLADALATFE